MSFFKEKIKVHEEALDVVTMIALSTLGHYVAKNNPDYIDDIESWYAGFQAIVELDDLNKAFKHAVHSLTEKFVDDPFVQLQIEQLTGILNITLEGPSIPEEILKYRKIVDAFMAGVKIMK